MTDFHFESVARPEYLIDRAARPRRLLDESRYAPCLTVIDVVGDDGAVRHRGLRHPEPAYYTLYRIDWVAFDRMAGAERQASAARRSVEAAMHEVVRPQPRDRVRPPAHGQPAPLDQQRGVMIGGLGRRPDPPGQRQRRREVGAANHAHQLRLAVDRLDRPARKSRPVAPRTRRGRAGASAKRTWRSKPRERR